MAEKCAGKSRKRRDWKIFRALQRISPWINGINNLNLFTSCWNIFGQKTNFYIFLFNRLTPGSGKNAGHCWGNFVAIFFLFTFGFFTLFFRLNSLGLDGFVVELSMIFSFRCLKSIVNLMYWQKIIRERRERKVSFCYLISNIKIHR